MSASRRTSDGLGGGSLRTRRTWVRFRGANPLTMVRHYKKVEGARRTRKYAPEQLKAALRDVAKELSFRAAAEKNSVPYTTVRENAQGEYSRTYGGQPVLTSVEEQTLEATLIQCAEHSRFLPVSS